MRAMKCPICGKFLKNIYCIFNEFDDSITEVIGQCIKHGEVLTDDWSCEDFFPYPKIKENEKTL